MAALHTASTSAADAQLTVQADDQQLRKLGYQPILHRCWSGFAALCIVLSSMSVLTSIIGATTAAVLVCNSQRRNSYVASMGRRLAQEPF